MASDLFNQMSHLKSLKKIASKIEDYKLKKKKKKLGIRSFFWLEKLRVRVRQIKLYIILKLPN